MTLTGVKHYLATKAAVLTSYVVSGVFTVTLETRLASVGIVPIIAVTTKPLVAIRPASTDTKKTDFQLQVDYP